jgi:hypothetical protein
MSCASASEQQQSGDDEDEHHLADSEGRPKVGGPQGEAQKRRQRECSHRDPDVGQRCDANRVTSEDPC